MVDRQGEDRRLLGGARDEVAGGRHQPDAEADRERAEQDRQRDPPPRHRRRRPRAGARCVMPPPHAVHRRPLDRTTRSAALRAPGRARRAAPSAPARSRIDGLGHRLGARRVEIGGRLVEDARAARRGGTRARARCAGAGRPRAAGRRRRRPSRTRPAARARSASAPAARPPRGRPSSAAAGSPRRMLSATVPRKSVGCCGTQAICARHAAGSQSARSTPPAVTRPAVGSARSRSSDASVLLPPPLGPTSATDSPGSSSRSTPSSTTAARARGIRERHRFEPYGGLARARRDRRPPGGRRLRSSTRSSSRSADRAPVGARVELGGEVAQRQVQLRREHEHGQRRLEAEAAVDEAHADGDGDERDSRASPRARARCPRGTRHGACPSSPAGTRRSPARSARPAPRRG